MLFKDYYKILELETNKVNIDEIKSAYREQAKKYHPDVNIGNKNAEERFKDINEAYNILMNQATKRKYDRIWTSKIAKKRGENQKGQSQKKSTKSDVFEILFGNSESNEFKSRKKTNQKEPVQGENIDTELDVSIIEAFYGKEKKVSFRTVNGKMKTFNIKIPEGIRNAEKIRLIGQGKLGENGGKNGDLLIKINIINDQEYSLIGSNIYKNVYISPWEAVLGAKIITSTIDNEISIYIPKGSQTGETIEVPGEGYKDGLGGRGKLILKINIMIPKNATDTEKDLYKKLKNLSKFNPRQIYS